MKVKPQRLYDLSEDLGEKNSKSSTNITLVNQLRKMLFQWLKNAKAVELIMAQK